MWQGKVADPTRKKDTLGTLVLLLYYSVQVVVVRSKVIGNMAEAGPEQGQSRVGRGATYRGMVTVRGISGSRPLIPGQRPLSEPVTMLGTSAHSNRGTAGPR